MRGLLLLLSLLTLASCARDMGGWFEPPMARTPRLGPISPYARPFVKMSDPGVTNMFIRDIEGTLNNNAWRWTGKSPALRLQLSTAANQHFVADFAVPEPGFAHTGPVQITIQINGRTLATVNCDKPGPHHIDQAVPSDWLNTQLDNFAAFEIDKTWRDNGMDHDYGFILTDAGFVTQNPTK